MAVAKENDRLFQGSTLQNCIDTAKLSPSVCLVDTITQRVYNLLFSQLTRLLFVVTHHLHPHQYTTLL
jgi:hypothetical protein